MRMRHFRPFWPRPPVRRGPARRPGKGHGLLLSGLAGIAAALAAIALMDARIRPVLDAMATARVTNAVTQTLDGAVSDYIAEHALTYPDFIKMERDGAGQVTALTSDMAALNGLRTGILGRVAGEVDRMDTTGLSIPVGNLTGVNFLSGKGLELPLEVVSAGSAHAEFRNVFSDAGINQTRHQIVLDVTVTVEILLPRETLRTEVSAEVPVTETVIVGAVPDTYLQLGT